MMIFFSLFFLLYNDVKSEKAYNDHKCTQAIEEYDLCTSNGLSEACIDPKEICK